MRPTSLQKALLAAIATAGGAKIHVQRGAVIYSIDHDPRLAAFSSVLRHQVTDLTWTAIERDGWVDVLRIGHPETPSTRYCLTQPGLGWVPEVFRSPAETTQGPAGGRRTLTPPANGETAGEAVGETARKGNEMPKKDATDTPTGKHVAQAEAEPQVKLVKMTKPQKTLLEALKGATEPVTVAVLKEKLGHLDHMTIQAVKTRGWVKGTWTDGFQLIDEGEKALAAQG